MRHRNTNIENENSPLKSRINIYTIHKSTSFNLMISRLPNFIPVNFSPLLSMEKQSECLRAPQCVCVHVNPQQLLASPAHTVFHYTFILLPVPVPFRTTQIPQGSNPGMCVEKPATNYMAWPIPCLIIQIYS